MHIIMWVLRSVRGPLCVFGAHGGRKRFPSHDKTKLIASITDIICKLAAIGCVRLSICECEFTSRLLSRTFFFFIFPPLLLTEFPLTVFGSAHRIGYCLFSQYYSLEYIPAIV